MYDGNEAIHMALQLREHFDSPAAMLAALSANMDLSDDVAEAIGLLAADHDPDGIAWLASVFYAAGRMDRSESDLRARTYDAYSRMARSRSATCRPNSDASV